MRKLAIAGAVLLGLLAAAVVVGPRLIDWNRYKPEIAGRLEEALDRRVEIEGDLSLGLVPVPALSVERVRLANLPGASEPYMATVESLRLRLNPAALLRGAVRVESLILVEPVMRLQEFEDGRVNWRFGGKRDSAKPAESPGSLRETTEVRFDRLIIESGVVTYERPRAQAVRVEDIDASVSAGSLNGPFQVSGDAVWRGTELVFEATTGRLSGDGPAAFNAVLRLPGAKAQAKMAGQIATAEEVLIRAKVTASSDSFEQVAALAMDPSGFPVNLRQPFSFEGGIEVSPGRVTVNELSARLGETRVGGALAARLAGRPNIDATLAFGRLDLDALVTADTPPAGPNEPQPQDGSSPVAGLALPEGLDATVNATADVVVYRGGIVRQAKLDAALGEGRLAVRRATALLPGGSDVSLSGDLRGVDGNLAVNGAVEAVSDNLRAVFDWLGVPVADVPADRLRKFAAHAAIKGTLDQLQVSDVDVRLDTSRLRGTATLRLEGRPAVGANLVIDNLNVDAYRPVARDGDEASGAPADGAAPDQAGLPILAAFDANVRARADSLTMNEVMARDVSFEGALVDGDLTIRQASVGDFGGASSQAQGRLANLAHGPIEFREFTFEARAAQPARVARVLGVVPGFDINRLGPVAVRGSLDGPMSEFSLAGRAELAGGEMEAKGVVSVGDVTEMRLDLSASHPDTVALARVFQPDYRPAGKLGSANLAAKVTVAGMRAEASEIRLVIGSADLSGSASADLTAKPKVTARLDAGEVVVDRFLPVNRAALLPRPPSDWLVAPATPQPVKFRLGAPPSQAHGATNHLAGGAPWSREPFDLGWLDAFEADVSLAAKAVAYKEYRLDNVQAVARVADGAAVLRSLDGALFDGPISADARLTRNGALTGAVSLRDARLREALATTAGIDVASGILSAGATFESGGNSTYEWAANVSGDGELSVRDGVVRGLDLGAISRRLDNIENVGSLLGLLQEGLSGGQTPFSSLAATFAARRGVITSQDIALRAEAGEGKGTATVDLANYAVQARMLFTLSAHPGMPPFGVRLEGPLDNPRRFFDVNELQAWLVSKGMGRLLKERGGEAGKVIQELLGGQPKSQSQGAPAPQPSPRPEEVFKGLLDQLGRQ